MPSTAGYTLLRSVKITSLSTLVDNTNNVYTYTDSYSDAYQFYNNTGTDVEVGDRIILLDSQDYYLMKAADYANTYVGTEGGLDELTSLTINTGGTASDTLAAMTVTTPADLAAVAAQLVIIQNSIKSLATKVNQLIAANP